MQSTVVLLIWYAPVSPCFCLTMATCADAQTDNWFSVGTVGTMGLISSKNRKDYLELTWLYCPSAVTHKYAINLKKFKKTWFCYRYIPSLLHYKKRSDRRQIFLTLPNLAKATVKSPIFRCVLACDRKESSSLSIPSRKLRLACFTIFTVLESTVLRQLSSILRHLLNVCSLYRPWYSILYLYHK